MSTKVFNGFHFAFSDLNSIHQAISAWRNELIPLHKAKIASFRADVAVSMFDQETLFPGRHGGKSPYTEGFSQLLERQSEIRKTGYRDVAVDFDFEISLLPHRTGIYGITYTEQHDWRDLWSNKDFVEDFSYWNNSDRPKDIPPEEWDFRSGVWEEIFGEPGKSTPSMAGFTAVCTDQIVSTSAHDFNLALPSFDARVMARAQENVVSTEYKSRLGGDEGYAASVSDPKIDVFAVYSRCVSWLKSDAGALALEAERLRVASLLQKEVSIDNLNRRIPELASKN